MFTNQLRIVGVVVLLTVAAASLPADASLIIEGPALPNNYPLVSGLQITTKEAITLESVVFNNQGKADTVSVTYFDGNFIERTVASVDTPAGDMAFTVALDCSLDDNKTYFILFAEADNGKSSGAYVQSSVSNDHIIVDGAVYGRWHVPQNFWVSFTDITTTPTPATLSLVPGDNLPVETGGGSDTVGGIDFFFEEITVGGVLTVVYNPTPIDELTPEYIDTIDFFLPGDPLEIWDIDFDGEFDGIVTLTFAYDEANLIVPEEHLRIYHQLLDSSWEVLPVISRDLDNNTITVTTTSFSDFAVGAVPEPATLSLLIFGSLAILRKRRKQ
ncbi:MAG: PEP-CTERM sorting domain-containing protein [Phycisphaerae bacterium]|jgi:hypothetical protein|nr:PEP-CTERM sorting domain-containing protein [Phycisphaerae bacterium]